MVQNDNDIEILDVDVLVIGGGIAGLFGAINAKEHHPEQRVLLVDKAQPGASGASVFAAGVLTYCLPDDPDLESYKREIIEDNSEYMIDQDYVDTAMQESYERFKDLVGFGVNFIRNADGSVKRVPALGTAYGRCSPYSGGGPHLMWTVRRHAVNRGVQMLERTVVTDLLLADGCCAGAVGFGARDGRVYVFRAKSTLLCAGGLVYNRAPMGSAGATGDGMALALRAGIELRNMEQSGNATIGPKGLGSPGLHIIFGLGAILVNARGERFMERYRPDLIEEARRFELSRAVLQEWAAGRGPCYVDCTHLPQESITTIKRSLPLLARGLAARRLDLSKDRIEYVSYGLSMAGLGGVCIRNADGDVNMPGVWAAGWATDFCGGVMATPAASLCGSSSVGARAGRKAAERAAEIATPSIDLADAKEMVRAAIAPLSKQKSGSMEDLTLRFQGGIYQNINLIKDEGRLKVALSELEAVESELEASGAADAHELRKLHDLRNQVQLAHLSALASLMRQESRMSHFRADYPNRDDESWLRWIVAKRVGGRLELRTEDVPVEKWRYKPGKLEDKVRTP
ncbi:MAG: FAD-binding protein [Chloroflexi bacterium]|nr:FAD-binding protein [Chloroflexota bacterium]